MIPRLLVFAETICAASGRVSLLRNLYAPLEIAQPVAAILLRQLMKTRPQRVTHGWDGGGRSSQSRFAAGLVGDSWFPIWTECFSENSARHDFAIKLGANAFEPCVQVPAALCGERSAAMHP